MKNITAISLSGTYEISQFIHYTTKIYYCTTYNRFHPIGVLPIKQLNLFQITYHPKHGLKQVLSNVDIQH